MHSRRVTFEHEAAHTVLARKGNGRVDYIDLSAQPLGGGMFSYGHSSWKPPLGDVNTLLAGTVAGPVQTRITVSREGLPNTEYDAALHGESITFGRTCNTNTSSARAEIEKHLAAIEAYLRTPVVQAAIQTIADELQARYDAGDTRIPWPELEQLVVWDVLPSLPKL